MDSFLEDYPDVVKSQPGCFTALLTRLRDEGDHTDMQRWWQEMRKHNITPDGITPQTMMSAAPTADAAVRLKDPFLWDDPDTYE